MVMGLCFCCFSSLNCFSASVFVKICLLFICNAMCVPSMVDNLVSPFILREAGILVHAVPKIHKKRQQKKDYSIYFPV